MLSPTEPVMIVLQALLPGRARARVARSSSTRSGASCPRRSTRRNGAPSCPALVVGTLLFLVGAVLGYVFVVPQALRVLFSFQTDALQPMITYDAYFGFVLQILIGLGLSFEIPLVITILAGFGLVTPAGAPPVPAVRGRAGLRRRRAALAGRGRALDADDDDPASSCCTRSGWPGPC